MAKARARRDPRNGRWRIRAYAGIDPQTHRQRPDVGENLPADATEAEIEAACARVEERAAFLMETGEDMTLDGLVSWYVGTLRDANRPAGTLKTYRSWYFRHVSPRRGRTPAAEVRPWMISRDLAAAVDGIDRDPISPRTANGIRSLLHAAYAAAVANGIVPSNPVSAVAKLDEDERDYVRVFDDREIAALSAWFDEPSGLWDVRCAQAAADLALDTGLRVGEVCGLRMRDFNERARRIVVARQANGAGGLHLKSTKGKRHRTIALAPSTAEKLARWNAGVREKFGGSCELSFPTFDGRLREPSTISQAFGAACDQLGLGDRRFHELRHTHATWLLEQGVSPKTVAERLGDSNEAFLLATYGHVLPGRDKEAADAFGDLRKGIYPRKEGETRWPRG